MKRREFATLLGAGVMAHPVLAADNELTAKQKSEGWKLVFDGMSLAGWKTTGRAEAWTIVEGAITRSSGGGGYAYTEQQFEDFVLQVDYKMGARVNSGVFFRWSNLNDPVNTGIEMQVYDSHGREKPGKHDNGAIYDLIAPSKNTTKPAGDWNHAVITCDGPKLMIEMNGEKICEMNVDKWTEAGKNPDGTGNKFRYAYKDLPRKGHLGFQDHGGMVAFKNVKIKELKSSLKSK